MHIKIQVESWNKTDMIIRCSYYCNNSTIAVNIKKYEIISVNQMFSIVLFYLPISWDWQKDLNL